MAKQCPDCQQLLDENARFCPICGAQVSQIKPLDAPIEIADSQLPPPLIPESSGTVSPTGPPADSSRAGLLKPALLAGILLGVTSALPLINCCCWFWVVGAGVLAVFFHRNDISGEITAGTGARLGFLTGIVGAGFWELIDLPISYLYGPQRVRQLEDLVENAHHLNAETLQVFKWVLELLKEPFHPALILLGILSKLFICGIFTTIGGILGVAFFGRPKPPAR